MEHKDKPELNISGPWTEEEIINYLEKITIPLRLSVFNKNGWPVVVSLWFVTYGETLWCATPSSAYLAKLLKHTDRCGFEIAAENPPYKGVRGRGYIEVQNDVDNKILLSLIDKYLPGRDAPLAKWLLGRDDDELALSIKPIRFQSWDYTTRMNVGS